MLLEHLKTVWMEWEVHFMILLSLCLQSILILIGNMRKYSTENWLIELVLWLAYVSANWVATIALGVLAKYSIDSKDGNYVLLALWAPLLLLHLGGPDNITAYSLEDNQLWMRHFLGLLVQLAVALFVFFRSWKTATLNFLAMPMFIAGIIKYGERTWVLRSASSKNFRESMLPHPDPSPNYARIMEEYRSKKADVDISVTFTDHFGMVTNYNSYTAILHHAYHFLKTFKRLFADLILSMHGIRDSGSFFLELPYDEAFKVIEVELGFIYDLFYTKAVLVYSRVGCFLRSVSFSSTISVFVTFLVTEKHGYSRVNVIITYLLMAGAILLEIYAVTVLLSSDWALLWFSRHKNNNRVADLMYRAFSPTPLTKKKKRWWSNSMAQYNLIRFCLKERPPKCGAFQKFFGIYQFLENQRYTDSMDVSDELKHLIFGQLVEKLRGAPFYGEYRQLCTQRGKQVLEKANCLDKFGWSIDVEFDQSILLWHIATDLCYYSDLNNKSYFVRGANCKNSKLLSDYMLYLLVICPFMLPNRIGQISFHEDTCAEAIDFFEERKSIRNEGQACSMLLDVNTEIPLSEVKGDRSNSVLFDACRLAKSLQSLDTEEQGDERKKWDLIGHVWVEMLSYAASQCQWNPHAQQLRRGGELLTHVWLLMAHLGITEQYQITKGTFTFPFFRKREGGSNQV